MVDYIIVISILSAFFIKQVESYYEEKFKNLNDSYSESILFEKIKKLNLLFSFTILVLVLAIIYWVYNLSV
jgi:hypothetical protein